MPFTLYHLGPVLLFGLPLRRRIDLMTLLIASVILDVEPALVLIGVLPAPYHWFEHTFLGATIVAGLVTGGMVLGARRFPTRFNRLRSGEIGITGIAIASLIGTWLHVTLDSIVHPTMYPFVPIASDTLYNVTSAGIVHNICYDTFLIGFGASIPIIHTSMTGTKD